MKITRIRLYTMRSETDAGDANATGASSADTDWRANMRVANPMSVYPEYAASRSLWMGPGQTPYAIEIETDDGHVGEALNMGGGPWACALIGQHFKRFLIGQNPFDIERIWDQMDRASRPCGLGGIHGMAMAGVDLALHDLVARSLGIPVYRLLGGKTKDALPCYATIHPDDATAWKDSGFFGIKVAAPWGAADGRDGLARTEALLRHLRETLGDGTELMIDCFLSWDREFAVRLASRIRDLDVKWFEDPLPNGWAAAENARLRPLLAPVQLAVGNLEFHERAFRDLVAAGGADILQPELQWMGGITPLRRIGALAKLHDIPLSPHAGSVYSYHYAMADTNCPYVEFINADTGGRVRSKFDALCDEPLPQNGHIHLNDHETGFGVRLNHEKLVPWPADPAAPTPSA